MGAVLTRSSYRDQILKSGYLNQLYTCLRSQERPDAPDTLTTGELLLHPQIGGAVDEAMTVQDHRMRFKTIDLTAPATEFDAGLRGVVI
jgi:5-methylcytosine-specific restriction enzyme subunit McrC